MTENSITAQVIKFIKLTGNVVFGTGNAIIGFAGRVTGTEENATVIEDISYANTITIYIERDFSESDNVTQGELGGQAGSEAINLSNLIAGKDYEDTERTSSPVSPNHEGFEDLDNDGRVSIGDIINLDPTLIIIPMTGAEELDSNRSYIRDIYNETSVKDDNYVLINNSNYVRATFSQALGKNNDITVFARAKTDNSVVINGAEIPYEIYQKKKRIDEINRILNGS